MLLNGRARWKRRNGFCSHMAMQRQQDRYATVHLRVQYKATSQSDVKLINSAAGDILIPTAHNPEVHSKESHPAQHPSQ